MPTTVAKNTMPNAPNAEENFDSRKFTRQVLPLSKLERGQSPAKSAVVA